MQITWELFEIRKDSQKHPSKHQDYIQSKLRLFVKQYNVLVCCLLKNLLTFE